MMSADLQHSLLLAFTFKLNVYCCMFQVNAVVRVCEMLKCVALQQMQVALSVCISSVPHTSVTESHIASPTIATHKRVTLWPDFATFCMPYASVSPTKPFDCRCTYRNVHVCTVVVCEKKGAFVLHVKPSFLPQTYMCLVRDLHAAWGVGKAPARREHMCQSC